MACKCFDTLGDQMKERLSNHHGDAVAKLDESGWAHQMYVLANGDHCSVVLPYTFNFFKRRKNGELEKRRTSGGSFMAINYCPFCGTKFEGSPKKEEPAS